MIKSEGTNHQRLFRKNDDYSKTEKENKNRRHGFREKLSDKELAKFQLNRLRGCRLAVKNVRLIFVPRKQEKNIFLRNRNRIITPNLMFTREGSSCNNNRRLTGDMLQAN